MSETQTPSNEDFMRAFVELQRKVADISNASVGGSQFATGDLITSFGTTRAGALFCDGSTIADADYPALGAFIRTNLPAAYIVDATHVKLPDYRGATIAGADAATFVLGVETGVEAVTLTSTQSGQPGIAASVTGAPSTPNTSAGSSHLHTYLFPGVITVQAGTGVNVNANTGASANSGAEAAHNHTLSAHTHTTPAVAAANAAAAHSNVQPTLPTNVFIKT